MIQPLNYPYHSDRFCFRTQALSREGLTGRCYWEVLFLKERVLIAVSYKDINRMERERSVFGKNDQSWALECVDNKYTFWFNNVKTTLSGPVSSRIGVYLDHSAGALSFYSVQGQTMTLLHKVQSTFTQPLLAGLLLYATGDTACFPNITQ